MQASTVGNVFNTTGNLTTRATPTTVASSDSSGFFSTADGGTILALLIILLMLMISVPIVIIILVKKLCWIRVEDLEKGKWKMKADLREGEEDENTKETQTELTGEALQDYYNRRKPIDMSQYYGKRLVEVEEPPRFHQLNPKSFNDPWSAKYNGKETNYITKNW